MAIAAIYILLAICFTLLYFGLNRQDPTLTIFSAILFIFAGLTIIRFGFEDLNHIYSQALAFILIAIGAYIGIRSGMDWISSSI